MSKAKTKTPALPVPQNNAEAEAMMTDYMRIANDIELEKIAADEAIFEIKEAASVTIKEKDKELKAKEKALQAYCEAHKDVLTNKGKVQHYNFANGVVRWRKGLKKVTIKDWEAVMRAIKELKLEHLFIRTVEEADKENMLKNPNLAQQIEGISINQGNTKFSIEPRLDNEVG